MDKGPFSIYDFIGYALPGASMIFLFPDWYVKYLPLDIYRPVEGVTFINTVAFIILSYVSGHLINFVSSLTIENLAIWLYGYPSSYLLKKPEKCRYLNSEYMSGDKYCLKYLFRILLWIFLLPISLMSLIVGGLLRTKDLILKPMGEDYWSALRTQWEKFIDKSDFQFLEKEHPEKYHRIIIDSAYRSNPINVKKLDNYVALYGFLRTFAFIMNLFTFKLIINTIYLFPNSLNNIWGGVGASVLSYLFFIAYLKFNRRYTLEAFMAFITNENLNE